MTAKQQKAKGSQPQKRRQPRGSASRPHVTYTRPALDIVGKGRRGCWRWAAVGLLTAASGDRRAIAALGAARASHWGSSWRCARHIAARTRAARTQAARTQAPRTPCRGARPARRRDNARGYLGKNTALGRQADVHCTNVRVKTVDAVARTRAVLTKVVGGTQVVVVAGDVAQGNPATRPCFTSILGCTAVLVVAGQAVLGRGADTQATQAKIVHRAGVVIGAGLAVANRDPNAVPGLAPVVAGTWVVIVAPGAFFGAGTLVQGIKRLFRLRLGGTDLEKQQQHQR